MDHRDRSDPDPHLSLPAQEPRRHAQRGSQLGAPGHHPTSGWRCELAGTWEGDITGAQTAANKELGYEANWVLNTTGYGYEQKENAHD